MPLRRNLKPSVTSPRETPFRILDADTGATLARVSEWQGGREYAFETMLLLAASGKLLDLVEDILDRVQLFDEELLTRARDIIAEARGEKRSNEPNQ